MEYIYAAMLLHKAGKEVNEANLTQVLNAAGINADVVRIKALVASLAEVNIDEAIKSQPAFMAAAPAPTAAPTPAPEAKKEKEKKTTEEETKEKEEAAMEGLGALFG